MDKALLPWGEATLLDHAVARLREVTDDVRILCGPGRRYENHGAPIIPDSVDDAGPIAGLLAALESAAADETPVCLWLGVDLPAVPVDFLRRLEATLREDPTVDAAMARTARGDEPLCAAFRVATCRPLAQHAITGTRLKLTDALSGARIAWMEAPQAWFANVNTPQEYERLREEISRSR